MTVLKPHLIADFGYEFDIQAMGSLTAQNYCGHYSGYGRRVASSRSATDERMPITASRYNATLAGSLLYCDAARNTVLPTRSPYTSFHTFPSINDLDIQQSLDETEGTPLR